MKIMTPPDIRVLATVFTLLVMTSGPLRAEEESSPMNLELKGTLVDPPACTINNGNTLSISFGDHIGIKKVASGIYLEDIPLDITCDESSLSWQLQLSVNGAAAGFDADNATLVSAEQPALGVKLYQNGTPFELGTTLNVNISTLPKLEGLLVQQEGAELEEGTFTATATLRAVYQ